LRGSLHQVTFKNVSVNAAYDTRCYFNVQSKADMSQLNLPHGTDNPKVEKQKKTKSKKRICSLALSDIGFVSNSANRCRTLTSLGPRGHSFYDCTAWRRSIALRRCVCVRNYLLPDTRLPSSAPHTSLHPITSDHHLLTVYSRLICSPRIWVA